MKHLLFASLIGVTPLLAAAQDMVTYTSDMSFDDATFAIESAIVMARPAWTAVSARRGGLTISLHATRVEHAYEDIAPAKGPHKVRDQPAFITQNEEIWSASWKEYGVHYALEVECDDPSEARCADDAKLRALAKTLRYVGGKLHAAQLEGGR